MIPDHLLRVFELLSRMSPSECYRLGAPILQDIGVPEPSLFRGVEPPQMGVMFRDGIKPSHEWFMICEDLGRFVTDPQVMAIALLRISVIRMVGKR